jgi:hypothetical protein
LEYMFCQTCGTESIEAVNYCKRCGSALGTVGDHDLRVSRGPGALVWALAFFTILVGLGGLVGVFAAAVAFREPGGEDDFSVMLMIFGSLSLCGVVALLIHMIFRLAAIGEKSKKEVPRVPAQRRTTPQLSPPSPVVASVTEHTTRTFDHVDRDTHA